VINQVIHANGKSRTRKINPENLEPLSPVLALCKNRFSLSSNFVTRCVGALLMPVERLASIRYISIPQSNGML